MESGYIEDELNTYTGTIVNETHMEYIEKRTNKA